MAGPGCDLPGHRSRLTEAATASMGAFEYTALDARPGAPGRPRGRHAATGAPAPARSAAAAGHGHRGGAEGSAARARSEFGSLRRGVSRARPATAHATARHAGALRPAAGRSAARRVRSRARSRACRASLLGVRSHVMEGHTLAERPADFPRVFPEIYRATVCGRRTVRHLDECWSASRTTPRAASRCARRSHAPCSIRSC